MLGQYLPVFAMIVLAVLFAALSLLASKLLAPRRSTEAKLAPYECGIVPGQDPPQRFPVRFFLVAMIFIVFDIEIIFLFPWATVFRELGLFGLVAVLIFAFAVFESFVYLIGNGVLDWGLLKQIRRTPMIDPARTATSTIRRVGTEGREAA
ncbi:MAG: NADH-quinone oxidoreductase subunit A [Acidimicrobiales bacterium]|nr:NADH-quinone oxidoreductase subunit A [Acidimicrobiales bacterium]